MPSKHRKRRQIYRAIDLFSGCGGLTLGLKQAGFRVVGAVENNCLAVETYKKNHKQVLTWHTDIRLLPISQIRRSLKIRKGDLDLLAGCPPCQGFSRMTTQNGKKRIRMNDARNDLVFQFIRFVRGLRPKAIMMENVPGLARNRRIREIKRQLVELGYKCRYQVFDAADFAVPQRRQRLILLAGKKGYIPFASPAKIRRTVRYAFKRIGPRVRNSSLHRLGERRSQKIKSLIRLIPKNGGSRLDLGNNQQLQCHQNCNGFKDIYGRMSWDDVAPTITSGCVNPSKGRFLHPIYNRSITLREAALLQSFPPSYFFSLRRGKYPVAEMIGNALPPEFIRRHALQIRKILGHQT